MSTSSSEEGCGMAGHSAASSGIESTGSLLFSVPSDSSDVQTETTPPTSPAPTEEKMRTPRDTLDAFRRLGQVSASVFQGDPTPTKAPKQSYRSCHRAASNSVANDEAGYDADGDGDGDGDESAGAGVSAARPIRRPGFLRIDTRQHKRVASMLATRCPSPLASFGDPDAHMTDIPRPQRAKLVPASAACLRPTAAVGGQAESYELGRRPRLGAEPVGLGIGFPENHPLRSRAFTMPVPVSVSLSPVDDDDDPKLSMGLGREAMERNVKERRSEWFSSPAWLKKTVQATVCAPNPVRLALRPTFLEVSPSPIEYLPAAAALSDAGTFRYDVGVQGRPMVPERDHGRHRMRNMVKCDAETERKQPTLLAGEDGDAPRELGGHDLSCRVASSLVSACTVRARA